MTDTDNKNNQAPFINVVNDPVVSDAYAIPILIDSAQLLHVRRKGLLSKLEQPLVYPLLGDSVERR